MSDDVTKPKRRGPPPPPLPVHIDPLSGPLKIGEAASVMRMGASTVRKHIIAGRLEGIRGGFVWGPSIRAFWDRERGRPSNEERSRMVQK
jgi:hypothetical protein